MSSSDLMGSRGSSWELVGELSAGGLLFPIHRGGAMWPCVAAVGAPLLRPRGSRALLVLACGQSVGAPMLYLCTRSCLAYIRA